MNNTEESTTFLYSYDNTSVHNDMLQVYVGAMALTTEMEKIYNHTKNDTMMGPEPEFSDMYFYCVGRDNLPK